MHHLQRFPLLFPHLERDYDAFRVLVLNVSVMIYKVINVILTEGDL